MKATPILALVLLAGCAGAVNDAGEAVDSCTTPIDGVPTLCLGVDLQARQIIVLGGECCLARWENVTIAVGGDDGCTIEAPSSGIILANDRATIPPKAVGLNCILKVAYNGVSLGAYSLGPQAAKDAQEAIAAQTRTWTLGEAK